MYIVYLDEWKIEFCYYQKTRRTFMVLVIINIFIASLIWISIVKDGSKVLRLGLSTRDANFPEVKIVAKSFFNETGTKLR